MAEIKAVGKRALRLDGEGAVGKRLYRVESPDKVCGKALFIEDLEPPGVLHARVLRSPHPHARVLEVDAEAARALSGVLAVLTARDIPGENLIGETVKDRPVLCGERVRFCGDPVALVAARTPEVAEEACSLIRVAYEPLPPVLSPEEALRPGSPSLHPGGNLLAERKVRRGDVEAALREAHLIVENTYQLPMIQHAYLEPDGAIALPQEGGRLKVLCASKDPHRDLEEVAEVLGVSPEAIALDEVTMGGGFGGKLDPPVIIFVALLAQRTGRPVKLIYSREESFGATNKRHPFTIHYTTAARRDGRIVAVRVRALADTGAYATVGSITLTRATIHAVGPYRVPNVDIHSRAVYTNNPISGAMRGFGVPQIALAHESQMDEIAGRLGLSPWEIRKLNALREGDETATGQRLEASVGITATLEKVERRARPGRPSTRIRGAKRRGRGVGCAFFGIGATGHPNPARCRMEVSPEGELILYAGATELGQGSHTALLQIAAESSGLRGEEVRLATINTEMVPDAGVTAASRVTYMVGRAVMGAGEGLREILFGKAAELLELDRRDLSFRNGFFSSVSLPRKRLPLEEVARACWEHGPPPRAEGYYEAPITQLTPEDGQGIAYATYAFATQAAEVEVDAETGVVEVLRITAAHDVGRAINPALVEGQVEGGCAMGAGYALTEEVLLEEGRMVNEELASYLLLTSLDVPEVQMLTVEAAEPTGPFGAKGVGEPAMIATAPAILNAIYDAVGVRLRELPATPERVLAALRKEKTESIKYGENS